MTVYVAIYHDRWAGDLLVGVFAAKEEGAAALAEVVGATVDVGEHGECLDGEGDKIGVCIETKVGERVRWFGHGA